MAAYEYTAERLGNPVGSALGTASQLIHGAAGQLIQGTINAASHPIQTLKQIAVSTVSSVKNSVVGCVSGPSVGGCASAAINLASNAALARDVTRIAAGAAISAGAKILEQQGIGDTIGSIASAGTLGDAIELRSSSLLVSEREDAADAILRDVGTPARGMNMDSTLASGATVRHSTTATAIGDDQVTLTNFGRSLGADAHHDVIVHGTSDGRPFVNGIVTHAQQIADAVLENPNYIPGCSITLVMCHGAREAAVELSRILNVDVVATTRQAQLDPVTGQLLQGKF